MNNDTCCCKFTAQNTPQQNAHVEKGFGNLYGRGRAIMVAANIPETVRYILFKKAFKHTTNMDILMVITIVNKEATRYEHFGKEVQNYIKALRT